MYRALSVARRCGLTTMGFRTANIQRFLGMSILNTPKNALICCRTYYLRLITMPRKVFPVTAPWLS